MFIIMDNNKILMKSVVFIFITNLQLLCFETLIISTLMFKISNIEQYKT